MGTKVFYWAWPGASHSRFVNVTCITLNTKNCSLFVMISLRLKIILNRRIDNSTGCPLQGIERGENINQSWRIDVSALQPCLQTYHDSCVAHQMS